MWKSVKPAQRSEYCSENFEQGLGKVKQEKLLGGYHQDAAKGLWLYERQVVWGTRKPRIPETSAGVSGNQLMKRASGMQN